MVLIKTNAYIVKLTPIYTKVSVLTLALQDITIILVTKNVAFVILDVKIVMVLIILAVQIVTKGLIYKIKSACKFA